MAVSSNAKVIEVGCIQSSKDSFKPRIVPNCAPKRVGGMVLIVKVPKDSVVTNIVRVDNTAKVIAVAILVVSMREPKEAT